MRTKTLEFPNTTFKNITAWATVFCLGLFFIAPTSTLQAQHYLVKQRFHLTPTPPSPNYANTSHWCALPQIKDSSDAVPAGLTAPTSAADPLAHVFFIHPTTYTRKPKTNYLWNQDVNDASLNQVVDNSPMKYQASAFNAAGQIFAPRYRQAHYSVFLTSHLEDKKAALDTAYEDVKAAFYHYLQHWNVGKPFIIASHSQGTIHAARLIKECILNTPLQQQLIVAYLPGMPVPKDSLPGLPICETPQATGCFVSWSTYRRDFIPPYYPLALERSVCVNPISWQHNETPASKNEHRGAVLSNFNQVLPNICDAQVKGGVLWVSKPKFRGSWLYTNPNYHIGDINLYYIDIRNNACERVSAYRRLQP